jgi:hypothetical protein
MDQFFFLCPDFLTSKALFTFANPQKIFGGEKNDVWELR